MSFDEATLNIVFIGAPGVVCYFILSRLVGRVGRNGFEVFLLIFMYAISAYVCYAYVARLAASIGITNMAAELVLASPSAMRIRTTDVAGASLAAIVLAYGLAYAYRKNIVNRLAQRIGASNRAGDEDVWHFFHNSSTEPWSSEWIIVRDHNVGLQYFGAVSHWSESGEERELVLTQVSVFRNSDGEPLYDCEHLYLCRNRNDLTIEIHAAGRGQKIG